MTATVPKPEDAAPSGAVVLTEAEALATLRMIAALQRRLCDQALPGGQGTAAKGETAPDSV